MKFKSSLIYVNSSWWSYNSFPFFSFSVFVVLLCSYWNLCEVDCFCFLRVMVVLIFARILGFFINLGCFYFHWWLVVFVSFNGFIWSGSTGRFAVFVCWFVILYIWIEWFLHVAEFACRIISLSRIYCLVFTCNQVQNFRFCLSGISCWMWIRFSSNFEVSYPCSCKGYGSDFVLLFSIYELWAKLNGRHTMFGFIYVVNLINRKFKLIDFI